MRAFAFNLIIAGIWILLSDSPGLDTFFIGFIIGFIFLLIFSAAAESNDYVNRVIAFIKFIFIFLREFIKSNITVAIIVLAKKRSDIHPGFFHYDVSDLNRVEIYVLSHCITLTPGTCVVDWDEQKESLVVHVLHTCNMHDVKQGIDQNIKDNILKFTRYEEEGGYL